MDKQKGKDLKSTEQLILEAAEREFAAKGFDGARTSSIAAEAGVTHAMLHYYFRTKEQLFQQVVSSKMESIMALIIMPLINSKEPIRERILRAAEQHFNFIEANRTLPMFLITIINTRRDMFFQAIESLADIDDKRNALQRELDVAAEKGEIRPIRAIDLMGDIVSLNAFPFLALPMMMRFMGESDVDKFLEMRKLEILETIKLRIS